MLPSDMNLRIGNVRNYNNKILISSPSFKIGTNVKINLDDDDTKVAKTDKLDVKPNKPDIKQNIEISRSKPDTNEITYEEEMVALVLGTAAVFTVWWMFK